MLLEAVRSLRHSRGTTLFVLFILTLTIAAGTVTFSVVDAVVLRPLPFPDADRLVAVEHQRGDRLWSSVKSLSAEQYLALRDQVDAFSALAAVDRRMQTLTGEGDPERVWSARVTSSLFDVLGVRPVIGQAFNADSEVAGRDRVALIGYGLWARRFGKDPAIVGRTIRVSNGTLEIVGVMPERFSYPLSDDKLIEIWTPYAIPPDERSGKQASMYLHVVGRLRAGVSPDVAQAQADAVRQAFASANRSAYTSTGRFAIVGLHEWTVGNVRGWMLLVLVAVGLVLLVACANVANLLLTRAMTRATELSIRSALGATRARLIAMLLTESALISACAVALALVVAYWGIEAARNALPPGIARARFIELNPRVFAAAVVAAVVTSAIVGIMPAFHAARHDLMSVLKHSGVAAARNRWRHVVLVAEIAFTAVLLVASTLFVSSFIRLVRADLGFDRSRLLELSATGLTGTIGEFASRMKAVPGVAAIGGAAAGSPPLVAAGFQGGSSGTTLRLPDAAPGAADVAAEFNRVTPGYFDALGVRLVRGRDFSEADMAPTMAQIAKTKTAILDEISARQLFGDRDPIGHDVIYGPFRVTVIGVVGHVSMRGPETASGPQAYFPGPRTASSYDYVIRTTRRPLDVIPDVQGAVASLVTSKDRPVQVRRLEDAFRNITAPRRFSASAMTMFGLLALIIGASGVFAVMSALVAQRTREIGVRMALGATPGQMLGTVMAQVARYVAAGLAVGLPAAWLASRSLDVLFFEVRPTDLWVYMTVAAILAVVAIAAAAVPARRAALIDPVLALRAE